DEVYGALTVYHRQPREFSDDYIELAMGFAAHAALAIQNNRLRESADHRARELAALYRADERMHRSLDLDEVLNALVDVAGDVLHADKVAVLIWDEQHQHLVVGAGRGLDPSAFEERLSPDDELARPMLNGSLLISSDITRDPRASPRMRALARTS